MKLNLTIKQKVYLGFALLIFLFVANAVVSVLTLSKNRKLINEISTIVDPSINSIQELDLMINKSKMLSTNWVFMKANVDDKKQLEVLINKDYPALKIKLNNLKSKWSNDTDQKDLDLIMKDFESLIAVQKEIMSTLVKFEDYEDVTIMFMAQDMVESSVLPMSADLNKKIFKLSESKRLEKVSYEEDLIQSSDVLRYSIVGLGIFTALLGIFASIFMASSITRPVLYIKDVLNKMSFGEIPQIKEANTNDEIGQMQQALQKVVQGVQQTTIFADKIGKNELETEYAPLSDKDVLGLSLINMRDNLKRSTIQERERAWVMEGLSKVNDLLRKHDLLEDLSNEVIRYLIERINAVQGAFYIVTERDTNNYRNTYLELFAIYAFNRKKYQQKRFRLGEGLIGQAAVEQFRVFRTEIPEDYVSISSGILGDKKPTCILIVPLVIDDVVYGVVEFAGLHKFTETEVRLIEESGPSMARTIFNIQANQHTRELLEKSQLMSQELQEKQEELLQNAEEMQVTQEELEKSNTMLSEQIEQVNFAQQRMQQLLYNANEIITIYEHDGTIRYISPSVKKILGYEPDEFIGAKGRTFVHEEDIHKSRKMFQSLVSEDGQTESIQYRFQKKDGTWIWLEASGNNLLKDPAVKGLVINARDITVKMKAEQEERMRKNMQALSENSPDLITRITADGKIAYANPMIETFSGVQASALNGKNIEEINTGTGIITSWREMLALLKETKDKAHKEYTYQTPDGKRIMMVNAIPEFNDGVLESILIVAHDITERKEAEMEIQDKNKKISESINYSKRIQTSVIPDNRIINDIFPNSYIFYRPRDVVSGDFPWFMKKDNEVYVAAVDCTGHGVPGAMLSLVGNFLLNDIIRNNKSLSPAVALDMLDEMVNKTLNTDKDDAIKDGMDIALCKINLKTNKIEYAGAHRPLYHVTETELKEYKGDKWAIGGGVYKNQTQFTNHEFVAKKGESIYFFSDGLPDQFGGPQVRKFGAPRIREIVQKHASDMKESYKVLVDEFEVWKKDQKQTDDVLLIGIKF